MCEPNRRQESKDTQGDGEAGEWKMKCVTNPDDLSQSPLAVNLDAVMDIVLATYGQMANMLAATLRTHLQYTVYLQYTPSVYRIPPVHTFSIRYTSSTHLQYTVCPHKQCGTLISTNIGTQT